MGFDPGTTNGLAILDYRGRILHLSSKKNRSLAEVLEIISKYGVPAILATDVTPPPKSVEKLASQTGAKLWTPEESLSREEKELLAREILGRKPKNDHERDALAAAYAAFLAYKRKFARVERTLERMGRKDLEDKVKTAVIFGMAAARAISELLKAEKAPERKEKTEQRPATVVRREEEKEKEAKKEKEEEIELLRQRVEELKRKIVALEVELKRSENRFWRELRREKIFENMRRRISQLSFELRRIREEKEKLEKRAGELILALREVAKGGTVLEVRGDHVEFEGVLLNLDEVPGKRITEDLMLLTSEEVQKLREKVLFRKDPVAWFETVRRRMANDRLKTGAQNK